jgi:hypothetical protein
MPATIQEDNAGRVVESDKARVLEMDKEQRRQYENFYWQDGYSIFSVNPSEIDRVVEYIENQNEHHQKRTFQQELVAFLKKYGVEYDERYLWE